VCVRERECEEMKTHRVPSMCGHTGGSLSSPIVCLLYCFSRSVINCEVWLLGIAATGGILERQGSDTGKESECSRYRESQRTLCASWRGGGEEKLATQSFELRVTRMTWNHAAFRVMRMKFWCSGRDVRMVTELTKRCHHLLDGRWSERLKNRNNCELSIVQT
jgi:hypothetical protein